MGGRGAKLNRFESIVQNSDDGINGPQYNVQPLPIDLSQYQEERKKGMTIAQAQAVISIEEQIRHFSREHVSIVDSAGRVISQYTGARGGVKVPRFVHQSGLTGIHNHPDGGTFSVTDIRSNMMNQFERLSVSTNKKTYILRHVDYKQLIKKNSKEMADAYEQYENSLMYKVKKFFFKIFGNNENNYKIQSSSRWFFQNASKFGFEYSEVEE